MINKKLILGMLIFLITIILATNVLAAEPKFDKKAYKNSLKYAYKQINNHKLVKKGVVDKTQAKKVVTKILKQRYQKGEKVSKWKIRVIIRSELNKLKSTKKTSLIQLWNKYKSKFSPKVQNQVNQITGGIVSPPVVEKPKTVLGCTDSKANNYDSKATKNVGCTYDVLGCVDGNANNYNLKANVNDGSCEYDVLGCTDSKAENYNLKANVDDGKCKYFTGGGSGSSSGGGSGGSTPPVVNIPGCIDAGANNFNGNANLNDGSCTYDVFGCTDATAFNYNLNANKNDGSCVAVVKGCMDVDAFNFNPNANVDGNNCIAIVNGCTDATAFNYNPSANVNDGGCVAVVKGCKDSDANNFNSNANVNDNSCTYDVLGCIDASANNFNGNANLNDGSCTYDVFGCVDDKYIEFDPNANKNDNSCQTLIVKGCLNNKYLEFNPNANAGDNSCATLIVNGCTDATAFNYNPSANVNDGGCVAVVKGCKDSDANNFNSNANVNDNSCTYNVLGCTDKIALNFNSNANVDDDSCQYPEKYLLHENILTTYFWVGEDAGEENSWVSNHHSAWDENWVGNYGGIDDPDCRNGYNPCGFTPKENPFYCALPYSDFDENGPKANRLDVPWYAAVDDQTSIIKNRWVKVIFNGKEAYCQLEDAGPGSNDDFVYVFGNAAPIHWDEIGLDTSPAVRDYLGLDGMDYTNWQFIDDEDVPNGPWKDIVTSSGTCWGSSCKEDVFGCTNPEAVNYNPVATIDNGNCEIAEPVELVESTLTEHNINVNFNNQVKSRKYLVYEPAGCKDKECSLLFMFHGLGGNYQQAAGNYYNWQATADANEFVVAYPDSLTLSAKLNGLDPAGKKWDITPLSFSATQDTKFVEEMITEIDEEYDVNKAEVFTTGHSYGGYFSYYLNFVLNSKFKAFATHSAGLIPHSQFGFNFYWPAAPKNANSGNVPAMIIYSAGDNVAPKLYSDTLESQMSAKGHTSVNKQKSTITGHAWDKSMNQEQWDFFMAS
jgi:predicted esterase